MAKKSEKKSDIVKGEKGKGESKKGSSVVKGGKSKGKDCC